MGVVLKRAQYFILCNNKYIVDNSYFKKDFIERNIILEENIVSTPKEQLRLF